MYRNRFLKKQKILHLATVDSHGVPHLVPVWYNYVGKKFYIGTNTKTKKVKNIIENNKICFCVDTGVWSPIDGVMGMGKAKIITHDEKVKKIASNILLRYFKTLNNKLAKQLLDQTNCIIEITPTRVTSWHY